MNADQLKGKWHEWKGEAKVQWSRLTDDELDRIGGEAEKLVGAIQQRYGYAKDRAQREVDNFLHRSSEDEVHGA